MEASHMCNFVIMSVLFEYEHPMQKTKEEEDGEFMDVGSSAAPGPGL